MTDEVKDPDSSNDQASQPAAVIAEDTAEAKADASSPEAKEPELTEAEKAPISRKRVHDSSPEVNNESEEIKNSDGTLKKSKVDDLGPEIEEAAVEKTAEVEDKSTEPTESSGDKLEDEQESNEVDKTTTHNSEKKGESAISELSNLDDAEHKDRQPAEDKSEKASASATTSSPSNEQGDKNGADKNGATGTATKVFGSGLTAGTSLFGSATAGNRVFGSGLFSGQGAFSFGQGSDPAKPTPFSAFSSNPFLSAFSKDKIDDEDDDGSADKEEEDDTKGSEFSPIAVLNQPKKIETGEELEASIFSCRAKLYSLDPTETDKGWKERGTGALHLNVQKDAEDSEAPYEITPETSKESTPTTRKSKSRIVMRSDGVLKVILNLPLVKGIEIMKGMKSSLASEKFVRISAFESHKPIQYALRMGNENTATEFYNKAKDLLAH